MEIRVFGDVLAEFAGRRGLDAKIHLHRDGAGQRVHHLDEFEALGFGSPPFGLARAK